MVLKNTGNITLYNLITNKLLVPRYKEFEENDNLRLVFQDLNNMQSTNSLLLQQEDDLHQAENIVLRLEKLDNFIAKTPSGNANFVRDMD